MAEQAPLVTRLALDNDPVTILASANRAVKSPVAGVVSAVSYVPNAALTGAASPASRTLSVINHGQDGSGTAVVATLALVGGVNLVAFDEKAITLSVTPADLVVAAGDVLEFRSVAVGGTGLVDPGGQVFIEISRTA